ncbi:hypothetical protein AACH06_03925 [Ideonella sp. DXS29W]|uniref:Uncharacterized protein n=1 Tax=Ideonella lacteola TaxID=2984193 RepID=A0ABU9BJF3_9BURK
METFAKDTKAKLQAGEAADAALCATGVVANTLGGGLASHLDGARLTAKQLNSQNPEDRAQLLSSLTRDFHSP